MSKRNLTRQGRGENSKYHNTEDYHYGSFNDTSTSSDTEEPAILSKRKEDEANGPNGKSIIQRLQEKKISKESKTSAANFDDDAALDIDKEMDRESVFQNDVSDADTIPIIGVNLSRSAANDKDDAECMAISASIIEKLEELSEVRTNCRQLAADVKTANEAAQELMGNLKKILNRSFVSGRFELTSDFNVADHAKKKPAGFPIQTLEEYMNFVDGATFEQSRYDESVLYLVSCGGCRLDQSVKEMVKETLANEVSENLAWSNPPVGSIVVKNDKYVTACHDAATIRVTNGKIKDCNGIINTTDFTKAFVGALANAKQRLRQAKKAEK